MWLAAGVEKEGWARAFHVVGGRGCGGGNGISKFSSLF
jgi:hypothetical protein